MFFTSKMTYKVYKIKTWYLEFLICLRFWVSHCIQQYSFFNIEKQYVGKLSTKSHFLLLALKIFAILKHNKVFFFLFTKDEFLFKVTSFAMKHTVILKKSIIMSPFEGSVLLGLHYNTHFVIIIGQSIKPMLKEPIFSMTICYYDTPSLSDK